MKKAILLCWLFAGHLSGFSQSFTEEFAGKASNPKDLILKNNIIRERIFSYTFSKKGKKDSSLFASLEYDSMGNMTQKTEFTRSGTALTAYKYDYNPDHSIHRKITDISGFPLGISIQEFVYDSVGNIDQVYIYNADTTSLVIQKNQYDDKRQLISTYTRKGAGEFFLTCRYYYSEDGRSSKEERFNGVGNPGTYNVTEYDSAENKKTYYVESKTGKNIWGTCFFDSANQCIRYMGKLSEMGFHASSPIYHPTTEGFTYNPDGTVFECNGLIDNKERRVFKHYYTRSSPPPQ